MTAGREEYDLEPLFYAPLRDPEAVRYRHEVLRDLEQRRGARVGPGLRQADACDARHLEQAQKLHYAHQQESWFLDAVELYCDAVAALAGELGAPRRRLARVPRPRPPTWPTTPGPTRFAGLAAETRALKADLAEVRYSVQHLGQPRHG